MLESVILSREAMTDRALYFALRTPLNAHYYSQLRTMAKQQRNLIQSDFGKQGGGKTTAQFYIFSKWAEFAGLDPDRFFVSFTPSEALTYLDAAQYGDVYCVDEQVDEYGEGAVREMNALTGVNTVVRQEKISMLYCSTMLRMDANHYILRSSGIYNNFQPLTLQNFNKDWKRLEELDLSKLRNIQILCDGTSKKPVGWISTGFPDLDFLTKKFLKDYLERKSKFIYSVTRQEKEMQKLDSFDEIAENFIDEYIIKKAMIFPNKKALRTQLFRMTKKNFTEDEWLTINGIVDIMCREKNIKPYSFEGD